MKNIVSRLSSLGITLVLTFGLTIIYSFNTLTAPSILSFSSFNIDNETRPFVPIEDEKLQVRGKLKNASGKVLPGGLIIISDSSGRVNLDTIITDSKGKYKFELEYNQEFKVYYVVEGYIKSYDHFKTNVPNSKKAKELHAPFMSPMLLKTDADVNKRAIERNPLYVIYFDRALDEFAVDVENVTAFMDKIIKPNVGEMYVSGSFKDTLIDTFRVKVLAEDTLGFSLAETQSNPDGTYSISVPLMNKIKLKFISENHYDSYAMVYSRVVPETNSGNDYKVKQDFNLVNKSDTTINTDAFDDPIARIEHFAETDDFVANPKVEKHFENKLTLGHKRIVLSGLLTTNDPTPLKGTVVTVRDGDVLVEEIKFDSNTYKVQLPYQSIVHVRFKTNGYHDSYISYNTNMDIDEIDNMNKITTNVELISRDRSQINTLAFKKPMAKYYYDNKTKKFESDTNISSEFLAMLNSPPSPPDTAITKTFVTIRGTVIDPTPGGGKIAFAKIRVLNKDRVLVSSYSANKKGRYEVTLGLNKIYYIEVEKDSFLATQTKINTHVPKGVEKNDLEDQYGQNLQILSPDMEITDPETGKAYKIRQEMLEQNASMAYIYNPKTKEFEEDPNVFDQFAEAIIAYKEPVEAEIAPVTAAQIAEAKRLEAENNRPKVPELRLAGKIVDERNIPISGVTVALYDGKKLVEEVKTNSLGNYNMELLTQKNLTMKVKGVKLYAVTSEINTTYPDSLEPKSEIITLPTLKTYTKSNVGINPIAFDVNWQKVDYDPESNRFKRDEKTPIIYANKLNSIPNNQYLMVEGRAKDQKGRNIGNAQILLSLNGKVIDTLNTDKKGKYNMKLEYQKDYRLEVIKEGYKSTFAAVSTNTNNKEERLIDKKIKGFNLLLVNKNEKNINNKVFDKPYSRVAFDPDLDEFVEVNSVTNNFLADLYIAPVTQPKEKDKNEYQLTSSPVSSAMKTTNKKGYAEKMYSSGAGKEAAAKRNQNKSQAEKSLFMDDFHNAISGIQTNRKTRISDVTLSLSEIFNAKTVFTGQSRKEKDANIAEAAEQKNNFNDIISNALGMRRNADLVSTDSTFIVNLLPRIKHIDQGQKIYTVSRDQVFVNGTMTEYVETTDWLVWNNYYKNNIKISASRYQAELDSIKSIGLVMK